jgi:hypothetical protein
MTIYPIMLHNSLIPKISKKEPLFCNLHKNQPYENPTGYLFLDEKEN